MSAYECVHVPIKAVGALFGVGGFIPFMIPPAIVYVLYRAYGALVFIIPAVAITAALITALVFSIRRDSKKRVLELQKLRTNAMYGKRDSTLFRCAVCTEPPTYTLELQGYSIPVCAEHYIQAERRLEERGM